MNKATAADVTRDLVLADYNAQSVKQPDGTYKVAAWSDDGPVSVTLISSFATAHAITGKTDRTEFT